MMKNASKIAVISGGSSGIGLACAHALIQRGYLVVIMARDAQRLREAAQSSGAKALPLDVTDREACHRAIGDIREKHGRIDWLIACAGTVEPGMFETLDYASHRAQMETNYFGALHLVEPVAAVMRDQGAGRITLVSSAAAFVGIAGYSAYAPSKFAVRALGETLRVELAPAGVQVSVAFPPDTDTPQLAKENLTKPEATKQITQSGGVFSAEVVAGKMIAQAESGRFMLSASPLMAAFGLFHSLYAPLFRAQQIRILRRFLKRI